MNCQGEGGHVSAPEDRAEITPQSPSREVDMAMGAQVQTKKEVAVNAALDALEATMGQNRELVLALHNRLSPVLSPLAQDSGEKDSEHDTALLSGRIRTSVSVLRGSSNIIRDALDRLEI